MKKVPSDNSPTAVVIFGLRTEYSVIFKLQDFFAVNLYFVLGVCTFWSHVDCATVTDVKHTSVPKSVPKVIFIRISLFRFQTVYRAVFCNTLQMRNK